MADYVSKPFTSQELWRCLLKYLTPVSIEIYDGEDRKSDDDVQKKLRIKFVKDNRNKYKELTEALDADDLTLAHRLAHTLKTNAGMIGKTALQNAAADIEYMLSAGSLPLSEQIAAIETELSSVLEELRPMLEEYEKSSSGEAPGAEVISALFEKLRQMLENINPECVNMLDKIRFIPGTEELVRQIEDYDFDSAALTLAEIERDLVN